MRVAATSPASVGHDVVTSDAALTRPSPATPRGSRRGPDAARPRGRPGGGARARHARQHRTSPADDLRPLRQPHRRGQLPPVLALADGRARSATGCTPRPGSTAPTGLARARRRAAGFFAWSQTEPGHGCPISMTYAAVPALRADEALAKEWTPGSRRRVRPRHPPARRKAGALAGMGMTEKQGGSDVRANVTEARPTEVDGEYTLHGHKWFTSAPMNDVFLVLAQATGGLTCFVVPRVLPDGTRNPLAWCGSRTSSATGPTPRPSSSSTARSRGGSATRAAASARSSRWWPRPGSTASSARPSLMRHALAEASWHVAHRSAFGRCSPTSR